MILSLISASIQAQDKPKAHRITYLDSGTASGSEVLLRAFRDEMNKLGWTEGKTFIIEYGFAEQKSERLPGLAAELMKRGPDLILVSGGPAAVAAKQATSTVPIVMANVGDPVAEGIVATLARPDGNTTGLSALSTELNTKRLETLKDTVPKMARAGLLLPPGTFIGQQLQVKELRSAAIALKLELEEANTDLEPKGLEKIFQSLQQKRVDGIMTTASRFFFAERKQITELANKQRLPAIYFQKEFVDEGGLMAYGVEFADLFRRGAHFVDKIFRGTKAADLPVQQATKFEFVINLKTAKQIGLIIPPNVLVRADRVIK